MMLKVLPLTALALGLSGGVALADHGRGGDHRGVTVEHRAPQARVEVRDRPGWHGGGNVVVRDHRDWNGGGRVIVRNEPRYYHTARRPIYISRPVFHERYFNYYRRPAIVVENYNAMPGYYWVAGSWAWDGSEWCWQPGHYEPDPNYVDSAEGGY